MPRAPCLSDLIETQPRRRDRVRSSPLASGPIRTIVTIAEDARPDFVKIDRHFIDGLASDPLKQQFVRSIVELASSSGSTVIAEGLEQESDLRILQRLGVNVCQGYLIARPVLLPRTSLRSDIEALLNRIALPPLLAPSGRPGAVDAEALARTGLTVTADVRCERVLDMFGHDQRLYSIPVLDDAERPIGLLRSLNTLKRLSEPFFRDLYGRKSCVELMDPHPLVFDASTTLRAMSEAVSNIDDRLMVDGFIVTRDGRYIGAGRTSDLLRAVSDHQISSARYANPLTLLPGNVPIDEQLESLLRQAAHFVVAYWDINHFKPFNDVYGYRAGDDMIQLTARLLSLDCDPEQDFVGHIGGDDFVTIYAGTDWEPRVRGVLARFDTEARTLFDPAHVAANGYVTHNRQGEEVLNPLVTLCAGVLPVAPDDAQTARRIAGTMAELKAQAKKLRGSAYFVERRRPGVERR